MGAAGAVTARSHPASPDTVENAYTTANAGYITSPGSTGLTIHFRFAEAVVTVPSCSR